MDIRNIKIEAPGLSEGHLEFLYEKGEEQLKEYQRIDNFEDYPLDVNTRKSQVILKDFIGRIIEELFEGYESIEQVVGIFIKKGFNVGALVNSECIEVLNGLQNANEEQADAIGFFISTLLFSNILPEDIYSYSTKVLGRKPNNLNELMSIGANRLYLKDALDNHHRRFPIFNDDMVWWLNDKGYKSNDIFEYIAGFHSVSSDELDDERNQLWLVVYELNKARNLLKNRPWKQTGVMTKELEFQESLVKSFIYYLGYLADRGFDQDKVVTLFNRKQALNMWRIKSGY